MLSYITLEPNRRLHKSSQPLLAATLSINLKEVTKSLNVLKSRALFYNLQTSLSHVTKNSL